MAEKRMFARKIIDSDAFLEMPLSAQALYFHLNMRADDDGFVNNPKRMSECGTHQNCTGASPGGGDVMLYCGWTDSPNNYGGIDYEAKER